MGHNLLLGISFLPEISGFTITKPLSFKQNDVSLRKVFMNNYFHDLKGISDKYLMNARIMIVHACYIAYLKSPHDNTGFSKYVICL